MDCTKVLAISDGKLVEYDEPMKLIKREGSLFGQLVFSLQNHIFTTNLHHSRFRSHSSIDAFPPSKPPSGVPASISLPPSQASSGVGGTIAFSPSKSFPKAPSKKWILGFEDSPISPISHHHRQHYSRRKSSYHTLGPTYPIHPHTYQGPSIFKSETPSSSPKSWDFAAPAPTSAVLSVPSPSPRISPLGSSLKKIKPPPPNKDCMMLSCSEPLTYTPPGSPCACVWPLQVKLRINIAIYKFFPLVFELAEEIAGSLLLNRNQVRIVGADAANHQLEKTTVLINLVPQGVKFDDITAFLIYKKFWHREILKDGSRFGAYEVLYVHYPGYKLIPCFLGLNWF